MHRPDRAEHINQEFFLGVRAFVFFGNTTLRGVIWKKCLIGSVEHFPRGYQTKL